MTVHDIVKAYLKANGYDGLCREDCGCGIDDLNTCAMAEAEDIPGDCVPAYKRPATQEDYDEIDGDFEVGDPIFSPIKERS